ncbi:MAG: uroporphyrinogen-III synthase [Acidobacteriaceae bacterium]|nr:uroporphyrinogen-III synthase [Acidobacteriaceae bacterium]
MPALAGLRIVVTRAAHQAEELARPLRELGADVILLPVIGIAPPADPKLLEEAAAHANDYDWIVFTSANAIGAFVARLPLTPGECRARIATLGAATERAAQAEGFLVSLTPEDYIAESLLEAFHPEDLKGRRILIPSAAVTRDVVAPELRKRGAVVDVVEAYRNVLPSDATQRASEIFREPYPDWVTFASSSAVDHLVSLIGVETLRRVKIVSIGPVTSRTIQRYGLDPAAEASEHTVNGLVRSIQLALQ